ncbi:hypothetical protein CPB84DRAFT_1822509 [Gymnopilus junonius]|uniref:Uncharacterized protein n=1 Tax=Gymnopilus junonius TaxID=109634 RepID=A0A9P5NW41_GYMJU|nr:hypothetical protein CPB84DRAFT_1822509 [Gymnopilus junonius]
MTSLHSQDVKLSAIPFAIGTTPVNKPIYPRRMTFLNQDKLVAFATMPTNIPQEMREEIIKYLHDDKDTLKAAVSPLAFSSPLAKGNKKHPIAIQFQKLLRSSPHLGKYVRFLQIFDFAPRFHALDDESEDWLSKDTVLKFCLPLLGCLRGIVISYRRGHGRAGLYEAWYPSTVRNGLVGALIQVLSLPSLILFDVEGFPLLGPALWTKHQASCVVHDENSQSLSFGSPRGQTSKLCLESLFFNVLDFNPEHNAALVKVNFDFSSLKRLSALAAFEVEGHRQVWEVIKGCLAALEELVFVPCLHFDDGYQDPIEWDKLSSLKWLDIRFHRDFHERTYEWLIESLKMKSSGNTGAEENTLTFWKGLVTVLRKRDRFPCLKNADLRVVDSDWDWAFDEEGNSIVEIFLSAVEPEDPSGPKFKFSLIRTRDEHPGFQLTHLDVSLTFLHCIVTSLARDEHPGFSADPTWMKAKHIDFEDEVW